MADPEPTERAMFPLESALLPDEELPLRIFEPRYGALVRRCIDNDEPFGVVLIAAGREVGGGDSRCDVGVLSTISEYADLGAGRYALRPELTAPVCRLVANGELARFPKPYKLYYFGPCFRYCRPQQGRYRLHQRAARGGR